MSQFLENISRFLLLLAASFLFALVLRPLALDLYDLADVKLMETGDRSAAKGLPFRVTPPPIGRNHILNRAELRWVFLTEKRLDMIKPHLNHNREEDVRAFSMLVQDFNRRAGKFRYEKTDYLAAKGDIKKYHLIIEDDALYELSARGFAGFGQPRERSNAALKTWTPKR